MDVLEIRIAVDANQRRDVSTAVEWMRAPASFNSYWIEEPAYLDDVLAHQAIARQIAPIRVASSERVQNRVVFE